MAWYNVDVLKRQHARFDLCKDADYRYVKIEHSSGRIEISFVGTKSGMASRPSAGFDRYEVFKEQAPHLTMRVVLRGNTNSYPNLKCCRELYGINDYCFNIVDKMYADEVLTAILADYDEPEGMKAYFLKMFDDWSEFVNTDNQKPLSTSQQSIGCVVGRLLDHEKTRYNNWHRIRSAFNIITSLPKIFRRSRAHNNCEWSVNLERIGQVD